MGKQHEPKMVVLGGGTGMPVLLRGLKEQPIELSTIVTVADDGGSTGRIRQAIDIPAPGDIRNVIAALANVDQELTTLFQHRFQGENGLSGHALGNLVLAAMNHVTGDFYTAVEKVSELFQVTGQVFPVSNEVIVIHAEMTDGTFVTGESNIPVEHKEIDRVFLTPEQLEPNPKVVQAILEADLIVISPGSLYTSILPNLIIDGVIQALNQTTAQVAYVCNVMTQYGETEKYTTKDHVDAIYRHVGEGTIDTVIVHNKPIDDVMLAQYEKELAEPVTYDREALLASGLHVLEEDIIDETGDMIRHDTYKLARILYQMAYKRMKK